jgi:cobalamin synthase
VLPPVANRESLSRDIGRQIDSVRLLLGTVMAVPGCAWLAIISPGRLAIAGAAVVALIAWLVLYVGRRLGGMTGDCLGFLCYAAQVVVLLMSAASWPWPAEGAR